MTRGSQQRFTPERILVVSLADLGDAILCTPALQALRAACPGAQITILTTPLGAAVLKNVPVHDELLVFDKHRFDHPRVLLHPDNLSYAFRLWRQLRRRRFDSFVLFHHLTTTFGTLKYAALGYASGARRRIGLDNGKGFFLTDRIPDEGFGARHQAEYWLELVGRLGANASPLPRFVFAPQDGVAIATRLGVELDRPTVALHPGTGAFAPARRWPPTRFAALADALIEDGLQLLLVGGAEEAGLRQDVLGTMRHAAAVRDIGGRTSLDELAALLARCSLFVGNDSGLAHLASGVGTPVVSIFGPTDPRAWGAFGGTGWTVAAVGRDGVAQLVSGPHRALKAEIACSPCIYRGHSLGTPQGCPDRTCLNRIDVEQVLDVVRQQLATTAASNAT